MTAVICPVAVGDVDAFCLLYLLSTDIDGQVVMKLTFGIRVPGTKTRTRRENKVSLFFFLSASDIITFVICTKFSLVCSIKADLFCFLYIFMLDANFATPVYLGKLKAL